MDEKTYDSLRAVLDYLEGTEYAEDHIYQHIERLMDWAEEVAKDFRLKVE